MAIEHHLTLTLVWFAFGASLVSACGRPAHFIAAAPPISVTRPKPIVAAQVFPGKYAGNATATAFLNPTDELAVSGALLSFEAGGRTAWHSHPAGQTLFITSGTGWVQQWGGKKIDVTRGDVVWTPPGVKHWHGATSTSEMTHVAVQAAAEGRVVDWMEAVTDEQYSAVNHRVAPPPGQWCIVGVDRTDRGHDLSNQPSPA